MNNYYNQQLECRTGQELQLSGTKLTDLNILNFDSQFELNQNNEVINVITQMTEPLSGTTNIGSGLDVFSASNHTSGTFKTISGIGLFGTLNTGSHLAITSSVVNKSYFNFFHAGQNGAATTRRLYPQTFYTVAYLTNSLGWQGATQMAPCDGFITELITHHSSVTAGGSNNVTYTVFTSQDNGTTWTATGLTTINSANNYFASYNSNYSIPLRRGDLFGVQVSFGGAVTSNNNAGCFKAAITYTWII